MMVQTNIEKLESLGQVKGDKRKKQEPLSESQKLEEMGKYTEEWPPLDNLMKVLVNMGAVVKNEDYFIDYTLSMFTMVNPSPSILAYAKQKASEWNTKYPYPKYDIAGSIEVDERYSGVEGEVVVYFQK